MNTSRSFSLRSWAYLLLFETLCFVLFLAISKLFDVWGIWNPSFVETGGIWKAAGTGFGLWSILVLVALFEHKAGIDSAGAILCAAVLAAPTSAFSFVVLWKTRIADIPFAGAAVLCVGAASVIGLLFALSALLIGRELEKKIGPLFALMGF